MFIQIHKDMSDKRWKQAKKAFFMTLFLWVVTWYRSGDDLFGLGILVQVAVFAVLSFPTVVLSDYLLMGSLKTIFGDKYKTDT